MKTSKRILLVEDDADDQLIFLEAIHKIHPSINCEIAGNGADALEKISKPPSYDIIFLDLNMPVMDGLTFLRKYKESAYTDIPIVVLTTSRNPADIKRSKSLGAAKYCVKPASYNALFEQLKSIVTEGAALHIA
jgi:CheY-like chemotaxis protein